MGGWPQLVEERTVRAGTAPGTVVRLGLRDEILSNIPVAIVTFYEHAVPIDDLVQGLAVALAAVPVYGGRMRTTPEGRLEIVCSDDGVPFVVYTVDETLPEAVGRAPSPSNGLVDHVDTDAAKTGDAPLLGIRINLLGDGGMAIATAFNHAVGDMQTYMLLMRAWSAAVDGRPVTQAVVVPDLDAHVGAVVPEHTVGEVSFRLPDTEERALLDDTLQQSLRANRTLQVYFTEAEVAQLRADLSAEAGRKLSTNDVLAAHIQTSLRDLDTDYTGPRPIVMPANLRPRLGLPDTVTGNVLGEISAVLAPEMSAAGFAAQIRARLEDPDYTPVSFRADHARIAELGDDHIMDVVPFAFDPARRAFSFSNWTRFGYDTLTFGGHPLVLMSPSVPVTLPWTSWMVEGFHGTGLLLTLVVPVRFATRLRGETGRARLHRHRPADDVAPELISRAGRII